MTDDCPSCDSDNVDCYDTDLLILHYVCMECQQEYTVTTKIVKVEKR